MLLYRYSAVMQQIHMFTLHHCQQLSNDSDVRVIQSIFKQPHYSRLLRLYLDIGEKSIGASSIDSVTGSVVAGRTSHGFCK